MDHVITLSETMGISDSNVEIITISKEILEKLKLGIESDLQANKSPDEIIKNASNVSPDLDFIWEKRPRIPKDIQFLISVVLQIITIAIMVYSLNISSPSGDIIFNKTEIKNMINQQFDLYNTQINHVSCNNTDNPNKTSDNQK